jgi:hypothetical protein
LIWELARLCPFSVRRASPRPGISWTATTSSHRTSSIWSVLIVVVVIGVISVAAMIAPVIGHGVSNCRAPDATDDRADRTADNSPGDSAPDTSSDRAAFVGKGNLR